MVSLMRFDALASTNYTIAKHLAKENKVFYIDHPFTWTDYLRKRKEPAFQCRKGLFSFFSKGIIRTEEAGLQVVIPPPVLPLNFLPEGRLYRLLLRINEWLVASRIRKIARAEKLSSYIYINAFNFHFPGINRLIQPALTVYHCVDPIIVEFDRRHGLVSELQLIKESNVVICTSRQLYTDKLQHNSHTFFVPNAADIAHSSKALDATLPVHASLVTIPGPVIGYLGAIERRMDYDLLKKVVELNPDKSFVLAGPADAAFLPDWVTAMPNVFLTGSVAYEEIPQLIKGFDVALIPFKKDAVSNTIFPLKLFEYLGAGKPVVATDFNPDLKEFTDDLVPFCADAATFSAAIAASLAQGKEHLQQRLSVAAANTWEKRGAAFAAIIAEAL